MSGTSDRGFKFSGPPATPGAPFNVVSLPAPPKLKKGRAV